MKVLGYITRQGQKFVRKCSLSSAKHILVDERIYCANKNEAMNQTKAVEYCTKLNATLPLPVNILEFEAFSNFSGPEKAWIGISRVLIWHFLLKFVVMVGLKTVEQCLVDSDRQRILKVCAL